MIFFVGQHDKSPSSSSRCRWSGGTCSNSWNKKIKNVKIWSKIYICNVFILTKRHGSFLNLAFRIPNIEKVPIIIIKQDVKLINLYPVFFYENPGFFFDKYSAELPDDPGQGVKLQVQLLSYIPTVITVENNSENYQ